MDTRRWHPESAQDYQKLIGREVYTHDGVDIGQVDRIVPPPPDLKGDELGHYIVVRPEMTNGPLGVDVVFVPETAVALASADAVELTVDANDLGKQGWDRLPEMLDQQDAPLPEEVPPAPEGGVYERRHQNAE